MSLPYTDSSSHTDSSHSKVVTNDVFPEQEALNQPGRFKAAYQRISASLGFKERFSLTFCIVFGGALLGFCMSRLMMLAPSNVIHKTVPGEWYWYRQALYKPNIFMHIYMSIVGGTLAILQFIPIIRRKMMIIHRINGWIVFLNLGIGSVTGSIVARRAFGGDLNSEAAYYTLGFMIGPAAMLGVFFARVRVNIALHREWMIRTVSYSGSVITARFITIMARAIISAIGTYYAMWRCDEIAFLLEDPNIIQKSFPVCVNATRPKRTFVPVHASIHQEPINFGATYRVTFGMALWLAILIHLAGTELYINLTKSYARPIQAPVDASGGGEKV
ncbi:hypothetical protein BN14_02166 [Rhizoctonia solani AG-1 IB]|uniref:Uncharacterized protein n=2 Tax=Rhizoctonia solani TaxID=456999 RepID=A0A8H3ADT4_9AGAM|nr:unnamed protein product [Rhizoctonia solani]CCO28173.1 hypothetical protein BN14_02166 [Rhizoctonia solani AG-1 IB]